MPVDITFKDLPLYQREIYKNGGIGRIYWDLRDKIIFSFIDDNGSIILDIGCGEGITLEKLIEQFGQNKIFGLDAMKENVSICRTQDLPVIQGDVFFLPFQANSLDCILFIEVIEHLSNPLNAILEIKRVLKKNGKLIILFPNDFTFKIARILTLKFKEAAFDPGHVKQWTPGSIVSFLESNDFKILDQKSIPFLFWPISLHHIVVCKKI